MRITVKKEKQIKKKRKIFRKLLSQNLKRIHQIGNLGVYERIILAGIRNHKDEV